MVRVAGVGPQARPTVVAPDTRHPRTLTTPLSRVKGALRTGNVGATCPVVGVAPRLEGAVSRRPQERARVAATVSNRWVL